MAISIYRSSKWTVGTIPGKRYLEESREVLSASVVSSLRPRLQQRETHGMMWSQWYRVEWDEFRHVTVQVGRAYEGGRLCRLLWMRE